MSAQDEVHAIALKKSALLAPAYRTWSISPGGTIATIMRTLAVWRMVPRDHDRLGSCQVQVLH